MLFPPILGAWDNSQGKSDALTDAWQQAYYLSRKLEWLSLRGNAGLNCFDTLDTTLEFLTAKYKAHPAKSYF